MAVELPFPPAPVSTDNQEVILWVVCVLVVVLAIVVGALWRIMNRNQTECREENARAWGECKALNDKVENLLTGALAETQTIARTAVDETRQTRKAIEENTKVLARIGTDRINRPT